MFNAGGGCVLALELEDVFKAKAKENQKISEGKGKQISAEVKVEPIETRQELAKIANVSHDFVLSIVDKTKKHKVQGLTFYQ